MSEMQGPMKLVPTGVIMRSLKRKLRVPQMQGPALTIVIHVEGWTDAQTVLSCSSSACSLCTACVEHKVFDVSILKIGHARTTRESIRIQTGCKFEVGFGALKVRPYTP